MKGMSKEEAVAKAISGAPFPSKESLRKARLAIAAADKWDAEDRRAEFVVTPEIGSEIASALESYKPRPAVYVSPGLDSAIQDELDHPPASIMEEGK
jgi:hypothetical protein